VIHQQGLTRQFAYIVAGIQLGAGVTGMILSDRFSGPSYKPARDLLGHLPRGPGIWWSALLTLLAVAALVMLRFRHQHVRTAFAFLCGYWGFWLILWTAAWSQPGSGPWAPWIALMCIAGNARPVVAPAAK
jgi:hypothetical protein